VLDGLEVGQQRREERKQRAVGHHHAVGGVVDDPDELLGRQSKVERVENRAHGGDRVVRLDMLGVVPHQRRDPVVVPDSEVVTQRVCQPGRPAPDLGERTPLRLALTGPGDHLR
jgi:hypothetical protein